MKIITIEIQRGTPGGKCQWPDKIEAVERSPVWAIHNTVLLGGCIAGLWTLTHRPTGYAIGANYHSQDAAFMAAKILDSLPITWDKFRPRDSDEARKMAGPYSRVIDAVKLGEFPRAFRLAKIAHGQLAKALTGIS